MKIIFETDIKFINLTYATNLKNKFYLGAAQYMNIAGLWSGYPYDSPKTHSEVKHSDTKFPTTLPGYKISKPYFFITLNVAFLSSEVMLIKYMPDLHSFKLISRVCALAYCDCLICLPFASNTFILISLYLEPRST